MHCPLWSPYALALHLFLLWTFLYGCFFMDDSSTLQLCGKKNSVNSRSNNKNRVISFPRPPVFPRPLSRGSRALPAPDDCGLPPVSGSPQRPGHRLQEKEESHRPASPSHHGISRRPVIVPTDCPIQLPTDCPIQFITEYPFQFSTEYPVQFTTESPIQLPTGCCLQSCAILRHRP